MTVEMSFRTASVDGRLILLDDKDEPAAWVARPTVTFPDFALCFNQLDPIFLVARESSLDDVKDLALRIVRTHPSYKFLRRSGKIPKAS